MSLLSGLPAETRRNIPLLFFAQAFLGAQMSMVFIVGGLAGQSLAPNICWATLPISLIVLGSMLTAQPLAAFMQRRGRRAGFLVGAGAGALGGMVGAAGLWTGNFWLFSSASLLTGIYMSAQGFFRFAAAESAPESFRPKAISYVLAGGLLAAVIGPQLVKLTADAMAITFLGTYAAAVVLNVVGSGLFLFLVRPARATVDPATAPAGRSRWQLLTTPRVLVAIICAMVSYSLMNLVMTSAPLAVVGCGFTKANAADVVSAHVLAMFVPSFFTGHLIARFGVRRIIATGLAILGSAGAVGLAGVELGNFFGTLVLLGVGWNFGFIGATTMLANAHRPEEAGRVQGLNDMIVFGFVTLTSFASGGLMNCAGGTPQEGWAAVNLAMLPLLTLAGATLIWLWQHPERDAAISGNKA